MRCLPVVLLVMALGACAPTAEQHRAARREAMQLELSSALSAWKSDVSLGRFGTSREAAVALASAYDGIYDRWGLRADRLTQAAMAYTVALADRVDRREVSTGDANALLEKMRIAMDKARDELTATRPDATRAARDGAMLGWWKAYWTANRTAYQVAPANPIVCETSIQSSHDESVMCR